MEIYSNIYIQNMHEKEDNYIQWHEKRLHDDDVEYTLSTPQIIETCPKDQKILLFDKYVKWNVGKYNSKLCEWEGTDGLFMDPTHWLPLPPHPKAKL